MANPYGMSDEQMQAYSAQVEEEKQNRANGIYPEGACSVREFCAWLREWAREERDVADQIKFGDPWLENVLRGKF